MRERIGRGLLYASVGGGGAVVAVTLVAMAVATSGPDTETDDSGTVRSTYWCVVAGDDHKPRLVDLEISQ